MIDKVLIKKREKVVGDTTKNMEKSKRLVKLTISLWILTLIALTIYSYSQIDLNLTLSSNTLLKIAQAGKISR